jgi:quercetin dioxygenase-like cupin family protein
MNANYLNLNNFNDSFYKRLQLMKIEISSLPSKEIIKGFNGRFVHTENLSIGFWEIDKDAVLPMHSHVHEQTTQVLEGEFELTVGGVLHHCIPGSIMVIPSYVEHGGRALTNCKIMDTFSPVREDYK